MKSNRVWIFYEGVIFKVVRFKLIFIYGIYLVVDNVIMCVRWMF